MNVAVLALAVAQLGVVAFLVWNHRERRRASPDTQALIALVDRLCQRIQDPAAAVLEHDELVRASRSEEYAPPAVAPDDDEAFWTSRNKLADLLMAEELDGR